MNRSLLLLFVLTMVALAACRVPPDEPVPRSAVIEATPTIVPRPTSSRPVTIRVELYEWSIATEPLHVAPGQYTIDIVNKGKRVHSLAVAGPSTDLESRRIGENGTTTLQVTLRPGDFTLWCPIGDHREFGMLDFLMVD